MSGMAARASGAVEVYDDVLEPLSDEGRAALLHDSGELFVSITFFLKPGRAPRCAHEALAARVWERHTRGLVAGRDYDPKRSGVEWWVQCRKKEKGAPYEEIAFHWDKDESLVDTRGRNKHPLVATVTYLSDVGAPTVLLACKTRERYHDFPVGPVSSAHVCYPKFGKHLAFDGGWLHGCPTELAADAGPEGTRLTFLANVWLDHVPRAVDPLPKAAVAELGLAPPDRPGGVRFRPPAEWEPRARGAEVVAAAEGETLRCRMGPTGEEFELRLAMPTEAIVAAARRGVDMLAVAEGVGRLVAQDRPAQPQAKKGRKVVRRIRVVRRSCKGKACEAKACKEEACKAKAACKSKAACKGKACKAKPSCKPKACKACPPPAG